MKLWLVLLNPDIPDYTEAELYIEEYTTQTNMINLTPTHFHPTEIKLCFVFGATGER